MKIDKDNLEMQLDVADAVEIELDVNKRNPQSYISNLRDQYSTMGFSVEVVARGRDNMTFTEDFKYSLKITRRKSDSNDTYS